jgi:hypothetical protein
MPAIVDDRDTHSDLFGERCTSSGLGDATNIIMS